MQETYTSQLEIKSLNEGTGQFSGYGAVFDNIDHDNDIIKKGAFAESLNAWEQKGILPSLLWMHDTTQPLGVYKSMREDTKGLFVEGELLIHDDPMAKKAFAHLKAGSVSGLSVCFQTKVYENNYENNTRIIKEADLFEISLVALPANTESRVTNIKRLFATGELPSKVQVEKYLREVMSIRQAKSLIAGGYGFLNPRQADQDIEEKEVQQLINILRG